MPTPRLRPMTVADIEPTSAAILADDWGDRRGWFEFAVGHPGCEPLVAEVDGLVVGTGVATISGPAAWIGTIWVAPAWRRHGLGRRLTEATMDLATAAGAATLVLVATHEGRPLYERLGFTVRTRYHTLEAPGRGGASRARPVRAFRADDFETMVALDRAATAEDRAHLLAAFAAPETTRVVTAPDDDSVRGFLIRPPWGGGATIAMDADAAIELLEERRDGYPTDRSVRCGLLAKNRAGRARLAELGWTTAWTAPRLERGAALELDPGAIWGQFNHAMG